MYLLINQQAVHMVEWVGEGIQEQGAEHKKKKSAFNPCPADLGYTLYLQTV